MQCQRHALESVLGHLQPAAGAASGAAAAAGESDAGKPWGGGWGQKYAFDHPPEPLYNLCKKKLLEGKQVFSYTMNSPDEALYL
eukprot:SAG22_NODE_22112_length_251_cov_0.993421_1_plen_83_part_11